MAYVDALVAGHPRPDVPAGRAAERAQALVDLRLAGLGWVWAAANDPDMRPLLEPLYRRTQLQTQMVLEAGRDARRALAEVGVESLLFKGAALVDAGVYSDPGTRPMDDADLLVRPEQAARAVEQLTAQGWEPWKAWSEARLHWSDSFALSREWATFEVAVDLHWRTEYGALRFGQGTSLLWEDVKDDGGVDPARHLLLVGEHLLKHLRVVPHLLGWSDLVRLIEGGIDWDSVTRSAQARWWGPALGGLLLGAQTHLGVDVPEAVPLELARRRPSLLDRTEELRPGRLALARAGAAGRGRGGGLLQRWHWAPGPGAVVRDIHAATWPPEVWRTARYGRAGQGLSGRFHHVLRIGRWLLGRGESPFGPHG